MVLSEACFVVVVVIFIFIFIFIFLYGGEFELCVHVKWYRFVCCDYDLHLHSTGLGQRRSHKLN